MLKKWLSEVKWFRRPTFNCGYGYGTWMLQDDMGLPLFCSKELSLLHEKYRVKPRDRESKNVPNRSKVKVFI